MKREGARRYERRSAKTSQLRSAPGLGEKGRLTGRTARLGGPGVGWVQDGPGRAGAKGVQMKVLLNHPAREKDIRGPKRVKDLLKELELLPESVLVIRGNELVTEDDTLRDEDQVEIRPVMSGGG